MHRLVTPAFFVYRSVETSAPKTTVYNIDILNCKQIISYIFIPVKVGENILTGG